MDTADLTEETAAPPPQEDMTVTEKANLAAFMNAERLKVLGGQIVTRFNGDKDSRAPRMQQVTRLQKMYALIAEKKSMPWANCANVKTPSLTGPVLQIQARLYDMLWPPTGKVFTVVPATVEDQQFSNQAEMFANSYVRYKMPYMSQGVSSVLHGKCLYGSSFRRTCWDAFEGKVRSDTVPIDDFVVRYSLRSKDPSLSDVPRYTMVHHMSGYEIRQHAERGLYVQADLLKTATKVPGDGEKTEFREAADKIDGASGGDDDADDDVSIRQVLEQHFTMRLPKSLGQHPAFDDKEHYVYALVDAWTSTVLRLSLREEDDPDDKRRYDRQLAKIEQQRQLEATPPPPPQQTMTPMPMPGEPDMAAPMMGGGMDSTMPGMPPEAPMPMAGGDGMGGTMVQPPAPVALPPLDPKLLPMSVRKRQIPFFTHYKCFESDGFYGLGYGDLLYGIVLASNTVINQWIDGMALKNSKPAFMSKQSRMARGQISTGPGQINEVDVPMGSIKDAIMFLDPPQADPGTVPLIRMLEGMRDVIAGNSDLMSGQAPGSNQTKGGMQILNEQMMAPITVLARQTKDEFAHELQKIWRCWGVFLEDEDITDVITDAGVPQKMPIGKWMFTPSVHLVPASDPRMKSQRLEDLQGLTQFLAGSPLMQNPQIMMPVMTKLAEMVLSVFPDGAPLIPLLKPPPPPPPQPMSQLEENVGFLRGQEHPVHPADDDDQHLAEIGSFMSGPDAGALDAKGKVAVDKHAREHVASRLQKRGQQFGIGQPPQGNPFGPQGGGPGPMAPGNGAGPPLGAPPQ